MGRNMLYKIGTFLFSYRLKKKYIHMLRKTTAIAAIAMATVIALLTPLLWLLPMLLLLKLLQSVLLLLALPYKTNPPFLRHCSGCEIEYTCL